MSFLPEHDAASAAVIGLGHVGSALAAVLAEGGIDVVGIDIDADLVSELDNRYCRYQEPGLPKLPGGSALPRIIRRYRQPTSSSSRWERPWAKGAC